MKFCPYCNRNVMPKKDKGSYVSAGWVFLLTVITGGLFLPLYIMYIPMAWASHIMFGSYYCPICNAKL